MTPGPWISALMAAAGLAALAVFAPLAKAADSKSPPGWTLWECPPVPGVCRVRGRPLGKTACLLDMASLAIVVASGTRLACISITEKPNARPVR